MPMRGIASFNYMGKNSKVNSRKNHKIHVVSSNSVKAPKNLKFSVQKREEMSK
jgi:hypothetical protein